MSDLTKDEVLRLLADAGCDEAVVVATLFVSALMEGDFFRAWYLVGADSRRAAAETYVEQTRLGLDGSEIARCAASLAELGPEHDLWVGFARAALAGWRLPFREVDFDATWGWDPRCRPVAPDFVAVLIVDAEEPVRSGELVHCDGERRAIPLLLRHLPDLGYRVVSIGVNPSLL